MDWEEACRGPGLGVSSHRTPGLPSTPAGHWPLTLFLVLMDVC